ncbi:HD domain-containing protein [Desulfuromonas acetoxidans]|uniref:HD domain-containing protein n=1 Tax=Desulfuromonas acetoxidans TaxID=891 RepID=UPI00292F24B2|nr:HD domain-containing protein [Desulfuromonas acetoxidans]
MNTIEHAIEIAARAHAGATDKGGAPYLFHPLRVMFAVSGEAAQIVAVLHDVVEDSSVTLEDLSRKGFSPEVVTAVDVLTRRCGESRLQAARRATKNPLARQVKLADVIDNMDMSRIAQPTAQDFSRLEEYARVRELLCSDDIL